MLHSFSFTEATPLIQFLEDHRDQWYNQPILNYYSDVPFAQFTKAAFVLEFRDFCAVVEYPCHSDLTLHILDPDSFRQDRHLRFLYNGCPGKDPGVLLAPRPFPCQGHRLTGIKPNRFGYSFRPLISGSRTLPEGRDYFNFISLSLDSGCSLTIHSSDAWYGGYFRVRDNNCGFRVLNLSPPVTRHRQKMHTIESDFGEGFDFSEQSLPISSGDLDTYKTGTPVQVPGHHCGCDVTVYTGGAYRTVLVLHKSIPTFDSSDRQYDSWHRLYLVQENSGNIHAVYATGGYEIAGIEGFAKVLAYPEVFQSYFHI